MFISTESEWKCGECGFSEKGAPPPTSRLLLFLHEGGCALAVTLAVASIILVRFVRPIYFLWGGLAVLLVVVALLVSDLLRKAAFFRAMKMRQCPKCAAKGRWSFKSKGGIV